MSGIELWSTVSLMAPLVAALLSLAGHRLAVRVGLALGAIGSSVGAAGVALTVRAEGVSRHVLGGWGRPLGIELHADGLSATFLVLTAVVGTATTVYATAYFAGARARGDAEGPSARGARYFAPLSLFLWSALNGVFLSADLFNLYIMLEIVSVSAAALVTLAVTAKATEAGARYLLASLTGSMLFLLGVTLLYLEHGTLSLENLAPVVGGVHAAWALAFMTVGLAIKTALFPLHAWLPPAHAAAPAPASTILSAVVVKSSFYVIARLWLHVFGVPVGGSVSSRALILMGALGAGAILWGSAMALRQSSLKRLIAYSTVAQLGYLFVAFPLLEVGGGSGSTAWNASAWSGGVYHAFAHGLAKAAMFLSAGNMSYATAEDAIESISGVAHHLPVSLLAFGLAGLSLAGIPPSAGFVAKWLLLSAAFEEGRWIWALVLAAGGLLTLAYVLRVARRAFEKREGPGTLRAVPRRMEWAAMTLALLSVLLGLRAVELLELVRVGGRGPWS